MAAKLCVRHEADEQHLIVDAIWRAVAKMILPQTIGLPRWPLVPREAHHIGTFAGLRNELEVGKDDLLEVT